jgi:acyl-homoserine lactone acylase PvdQ
MAKNQNYKVDSEAKQMIWEHFSMRLFDDNFGNGREARSLLETSVVYAASRLMQENKGKFTKKELQNITREDIEKAIHQVEYSNAVQGGEKKRTIGFNKIEKFLR